VLRFFAGPIIHRLSPLGLLAACSSLAVVGLLALSKTNGASMAAIFGAATLYGIGKTFFWPTMLAVASEQCPRGGALTLNAVGGIGMIAVVPESAAPEVIERLTAMNEPAFLIGEIIERREAGERLVWG